MSKQVPMYQKEKEAQMASMWANTWKARAYAVLAVSTGILSLVLAGSAIALTLSVVAGG